MERIYMDNAATTRVKDEVFEAMLPYFKEMYGNPSSIHSFGREAKKAVEYARGQVARAINAQKEDIYFTGGGTEADNWIVKGAAFGQRRKGNHIITSAIEHHALLHTCQWLEKQGFRVTYLPVDGDGLVNPEDLEKAITKDTILVSIMFANNEIGTVQPIKELATIAHAHNILFHTDAVQAFCHEAINVKEMGIDLLSASAHKIYGPKGVGLLYIRRGVKIQNLLDGGHQEGGRRPTTENVPGIVGFAEAARLASGERESEHERQAQLRDHAIKRILAEIPYSRLNGHPTKRLANNVNISFEFIEGEGMLLQLAFKGICVSSGSACTSGSLDPSHVLLAIGLKHEVAHGSMRMTTGRDTTLEDIDFAVDTLKQTIENLRSMSPLWEDFKAGHTTSIISEMEAERKAKRHA